MQEAISNIKTFFQSLSKSTEDASYTTASSLLSKIQLTSGNDHFDLHSKTLFINQSMNTEDTRAMAFIIVRDIELFYLTRTTSFYSADSEALSLALLVYVNAFARTDIETDYPERMYNDSSVAFALCLKFTNQLYIKELKLRYKDTIVYYIYHLYKRMSLLNASANRHYKQLTTKNADFSRIRNLDLFKLSTVIAKYVTMAVKEEIEEIENKQNNEESEEKEEKTKTPPKVFDDEDNQDEEEGSQSSDGDDEEEGESGDSDDDEDSDGSDGDSDDEESEEGEGDSDDEDGDGDEDSDNDDSGDGEEDSDSDVDSENEDESDSDEEGEESDSENSKDGKSKDKSSQSEVTSNSLSNLSEGTFDERSDLEREKTELKQIFSDIAKATKDVVTDIIDVADNDVEKLDRTITSYDSKWGFRIERIINEQDSALLAKLDDEYTPKIRGAESVARIADTLSQKISLLRKDFNYQSIGVPHRINNRDLFALHTGTKYDPYFTNQFTFENPKYKLYIDVSPSMDPYLHIIDTIRTLFSDMIVPEIGYFATELYNLGFNSDFYMTSNSTNFDCVVADMIKGRHSHVIIMTDNLGSLKDKSLFNYYKNLIPNNELINLFIKSPSASHAHNYKSENGLMPLTTEIVTIW